MDKQTQEQILKVEAECRKCFRNDGTLVLLKAQDILDIFAAFRLEIIKAGGRNA